MTRRTLFHLCQSSTTAWAPRGKPIKKPFVGDHSTHNDPSDAKGQ